MRPEKFINSSWYLQQKPYRQLRAADHYYLDLCRALYRLIEACARRTPPELPLDEEQYRWLAYVFTAYFEDRVSGIGFWEALVARHRAQFGKRLPFFDAELLARQEAEAEDILPADIHYLGYLALMDLNSIGRERFAQRFDEPFLLEVADTVFAHLDRQEEVLVTEFYEEYLQVPADYYTFRERFLWFAYHGYLTAYWYGELYNDWLDEAGLDGPKKDDFSWSIQVQEKERIAFEEAASCSGFFALDLFAGALRGPEAERQAVEQLKWRPSGVFELEDSSPRQHRLRHTGTGEVYLLETEGLGPAREMPAHHYVRLTLAPWKGRWFLSGGALMIPAQPSDLPAINFEGQHYYQKHYAPYRARLAAIAEKHRNLALEFFRSDLLEYPSGRALQKAVHDYDEWLGKKHGRKPVYTEIEADFLSEEGVALCLPPADEMRFVPGHAALLELLQSPEPDLKGEHLEDALFLLSDETSGADYWQLLRRHYALPGLSRLLGLPLESDADYEALLRLHFPQDFSPLRLPEISIAEGFGS